MLADGPHSPAPEGKISFHAAQRGPCQAGGAPSPEGPEEKDFGCIFSSRDEDTFPGA